MEAKKAEKERTPPEWLARALPDYADKPRLLVYVALVVGLGTACLILYSSPPELAQLISWPLLAWFAANFLSEFLWLETEDGDSTDSMASTMNLGVIMLLTATQSLWIISLSVFIATRYLQRRDWIKTAFGLGQMAITTCVAAVLFHAIHPGSVLGDQFGSPLSIVAMFVCSWAYFFVNTFLVVGALALQLNVPFWQSWRRNYGSRNGIVSSCALFLFTPLLIVAYDALGFGGVILFFFPLLIVKNQNRDYIQLKRMAEEKVQRERLVEAGRIARAIGHEIRNFLGVISGRVQLMGRHVSKIGDTRLDSDLQHIREQIENLAELSKQIMESTERGIRPKETDINRFLLKQVEMLRPYPKLAGTEIVPELSPEAGAAEFDPGQIRQVVVNLIKNAAEAMGDAEVESPVVTVRSRAVGRDAVRIEISDNGPGVPASLQEKIFDLMFTTKKYGHGFGLSTCRAILIKHNGSIRLHSEEGEGATFVLEFPRVHPETNREEPAPSRVSSGSGLSVGDAERGAA